MAKLTGILDGQTAAQQMTIDDYLALDRDESPLEAIAMVEKRSSMTTAGADPDVIMTDLGTSGDVSHLKNGTISHFGGDCPFAVQCEPRRALLPIYRQYQKCHWIVWRNWQSCPIYKSGGDEQC